MNERDKMIKTGGTIVMVVAGVNILFAIILLATNPNILSFIVTLAISIALIYGVNWVRWLFIIGGGIGIFTSLITFANLAGLGAPGWLWGILWLTFAISVASVLIIAMNKNVIEFFHNAKHGGREAIENQNAQLRNKVSALENKEAQNVKVPCLLCGEQIPKNSKFCNICGGNIEEKEAENKSIKLEELRQKMGDSAQNDLDLLLSDDNLVKEANSLRRLYGKTSCIAFLNKKAAELGLADLEITEEYYDNIIFERLREL